MRMFTLNELIQKDGGWIQRYRGRGWTMTLRISHVSYSERWMLTVLLVVNLEDDVAVGEVLSRTLTPAKDLRASVDADGASCPIAAAVLAARWLASYLGP